MKGQQFPWRQRVRQRLRRIARPIICGAIRPTRPLSRNWGYDRGTPVDRYYIEKFLASCSRDIRGRVLEVKDSKYTELFGYGVQEQNVLDVDPSNAGANIFAVLSSATGSSSTEFDCFILTQTLQCIYDASTALRHACRVLAPGGVLLSTVPCISRIISDPGLSDYWRFTVQSCTLLFGQVFGRDHVHVSSMGNVLTAIGFLAGMAAEEFSKTELDACDELFPVVITVRAVKTSE